MNILREVRRVRQKSIPARIILLLAFLAIFIVTTYAWFSTQNNITIGGGLGMNVTEWDVSYYVNSDENEILDNTTTFTIEELYPGMPERTDTVHIYNLGKASTSISYELISVKVFGQEVLSNLDIEVSNDGKTTTIFSADTQYPFSVSYTYDKTKIKDPYVDDETTPQAHATCKFNVSWPYEGQGNASENEAKDILDTKFGKDAYAYYQGEDNDPSKAIEVQVKITSSMIHPSEETQEETGELGVT